MVRFFMIPTSIKEDKLIDTQEAIQPRNATVKIK
jgi:hypothetical protein